MSLSFEELADAGLSDDSATLPTSGRPNSWLFVLLLCLICAAGGAYFYYSSEPELPEAAQILLSVDVPGVLPHQLDDVTEFEGALEYLNEGDAVAEYRVSNEVQAITDVSVAPRAVAELEVVEAIEVEMHTRVITEPGRVNSESVVGLEVSELVGEAVGDELSGTASEVLDHAPAIVLRPAVLETVESAFEQDWGGIVLVPDRMKLAKAYTSDVRLARIEAHPIDGERLRVWARIQNVTDVPMDAEIGCEFRFMQQGRSGRAQFESILIPPGGYVEKQFVSPQDRVASYTLMVKRVN